MPATTRTPARRRGLAKKDRTRRPTRRTRRTRRNPRGRGIRLLISERVLAVEYCHIASAGTTPYRHDFTHRGVELWLQDDGSILLRHPKYRLWEQRTVGDDA